MKYKEQLTIWLMLPPALRKTGNESINAAYIKKVLAKSLVIFKRKGPDCPSFFHGTTTELKWGEDNKTIHHPHFLMDIDHFLFKNTKLELAGLSLS
jgi:hypothetical protein